MKLLLESWKRFINEEDSQEEPEWLKQWQQTLLDQSSGLSLDEADKPRPRTAQNIRPFKDESESGFCLYNPKINDFARKDADQLAETILFVFGTMQTPWPKFVSYYRFIVDAIKQGEDIVSYAKAPKSPGKWDDWSKKNPTDDRSTWRQEKSVYDKETEKNRLRRLPIIRNVYLKANNLEEKDLSDEQIDYINKAVGSSAYIASTPGTRMWGPIWENRSSIYENLAPLIDNVKQNPNDPSNLFELYKETLKIQGLAKSKAGFLVQLLVGKLGCIDSIWSKIFNATDPEFAAKIEHALKSSPGENAREKTWSEHAQRYIDMLKTFEETTGMGSRELWDGWIDQVSLQIQTPGRYMGDYVLYGPDGEEILSGDVPYNYGKPVTQGGDESTTSPYYDEIDTGYDPENTRETGLFSSEEEEEDEEDKERVKKLAHTISKQHNPGEIGYLKEDVVRSTLKEAIKRGLLEVIKREDGKFCLKSKTGRNLGCYDSKKGAEKREQQVNYFKHKEG